jgi:hypothetical protein
MQTSCDPLFENCLIAFDPLITENRLRSRERAQSSSYVPRLAVLPLRAPRPSVLREIGCPAFSILWRQVVAC